MEKKKKTNWHSLSVDKVLEKVKSQPTGLSQKEANKRLKKLGPNQLPRPKLLSGLRIFLDQFRSPLIYILIIAGLVGLLLGRYTDSLVIFMAVFLNVSVGYFQERKASQALSQLQEKIKIKAVVIREGEEKQISQERIVVGDIILLRRGGKVPADGRIIEASNLKIDQSILTGEWLAATKKNHLLPPQTPLADRDNLVYLGTDIEEGWGKAVVIKTGLETEIGQVAEEVRQIKETKTPYQRRLSRFSKIIGLIILFISLIIFTEGLLSGNPFEQMFFIAVAVAIAAIPEGLPIAMTVILALGMQRILKRKGLVRRLNSAETLGNTSVIITDKTGTLTEAKMEVADIFTANDILSQEAKEDSQARQLALKTALLTIEAFAENEKDPMKKWRLRGKPTEKALLKAALQQGLSRQEIQLKERLIDRFLFNPADKYSVSLYCSANQSEAVLYLLGAPEKILSFSTHFQIREKKEKLLLADLEKIRRYYEKLSQQGLRILAAAYKPRIPKHQPLDKELINEMVFIAFFALHDPIRKEAPLALSICQQAGMKPIIATGDHRLTAQCIAEKIGLKLGPDNILEGSQLEKISDQELEERLASIQLYSRVTPKQKLRIVQAWQKAEEVVAMTGDGINDAPALKQADVGVALGSGTDIAKEVSDLILLDDNFNTIVSAVEEGRRILDNIRKTITYLLSDSFTEVILIGFSLLLGWPLPVLAVQILWVNLIEDGLPNIALAFEPKERDIMKQKPLAHRGKLLTREMKALIFIIGLITDFFLLGLFFVLLKYSAYEINHIRSIIFAGLSIDSLFYIFSCKSLKHNLWRINLLSNKFLIGAWLLGLAMLLAALYFAPLQTLLKTRPLNPGDWLMLLGLALINLILIELTKWHFISRHQTES